MRRLFKTKVKVTKPDGEVIYHNHRTCVHPELIDRGIKPEDEACHQSSMRCFCMTINSFKFECIECIECDPMTGDPL